MRAVVTKAEIESEIASRFGTAFQKHERRLGDVMSTGIEEIDAFTLGGLPRGALTEIFGPASSGRTSFMLSSLAYATNHDEVCAVVDTSNSFAPEAAAAAGVNFDRLLWIRCAHNLEHAFKATDLLLQGGGFGLVILDLGDIPGNSAKRIISSWWYRFRRTLEPTPTSLVVVAEESCVRSCAALALELSSENFFWTSTKQGINQEGFKQTKLRRALAPVASITSITRIAPVNPPAHANLLEGFSFQVECRRPLYFQRHSEPIVAKVSGLAP
jgi:hypothetical protein